MYIREEYSMDKDQIINFRVSAEEKTEFTKEAASYGMNLSSYILYLLRHKKVQVIAGGERLANVLYDLHLALNQFAYRPDIPIQELRTAISQGIENIKNVNEGIKNEHTEI